MEAGVGIVFLYNIIININFLSVLPNLPQFYPHFQRRASSAKAVKADGFGLIDWTSDHHVFVKGELAEL